MREEIGLDINEIRLELDKENRPPQGTRVAEGHTLRVDASNGSVSRAANFSMDKENRGKSQNLYTHPKLEVHPMLEYYNRQLGE